MQVGAHADAATAAQPTRVGLPRAAKAGNQSIDIDKDEEDEGEDEDEEGEREEKRRRAQEKEEEEEESEFDCCVVHFRVEALHADGTLKSARSSLAPFQFDCQPGEEWPTHAEYWGAAPFLARSVTLLNAELEQRGVPTRYELGAELQYRTKLMACPTEFLKPDGTPKAGSQFVSITNDRQLFRLVGEAQKGDRLPVFALHPSNQERAALITEGVAAEAKARLSAARAAKAQEAADKAAGKTGKAPSTSASKAARTTDSGSGALDDDDHVGDADDDEDAYEDWFAIAVHPLIGTKLSGDKYIIRAALMDDPDPDSGQIGFRPLIDNLFGLRALVQARHDAEKHGQLSTKGKNGAIELSLMARARDGQVAKNNSRTDIITPCDITESKWQVDKSDSSSLQVRLESGQRVRTRVRTLAIAVRVEPPAGGGGGGKRDSLGLGGGAGYCGSRDAVSTAGGGSISSLERATVAKTVTDIWKQRYLVTSATGEALKLSTDFICADADRLARFRGAPGNFYFAPELTPNLYEHMRPQNKTAGA